MPHCSTACTEGLSGFSSLSLISTPLLAPLHLQPEPWSCLGPCCATPAHQNQSPAVAAQSPSSSGMMLQGSSWATGREEGLDCALPCPASHTGLREAGRSLLGCWDGSLALRTSLPNILRAHFLYHFLYLLSYDCKLEFHSLPALLPR